MKRSAGLLILLTGALCIWVWSGGEHRERRAPPSSPPIATGRHLAHTESDETDSDTGQQRSDGRAEGGTTRVVVHVVDHTGSDAEGVLVVRGPAYEADYGELEGTATDARGRARFEIESDEESAEFCVKLGTSHRDGDPFHEPAGSVVLGEGEVTLTHRLLRPVRLDVRLVQGAVKIPFEMLRCAGLRMETVKYDAATGRLTGWIVPRRTASQLQLAYEHEQLGLWFPIASLELPASESGWTGEIPVQAGRLWIRCMGAPPETDFKLMLTREGGSLPWFEQPDKYRIEHTQWDESKRQPFVAAPGVYALRTFDSEVALARVELVAGGEATLVADASRIGRIRCRVLGPDGKDVKEVHVWINDLGILNSQRTEQGTFHTGLVESATPYRLGVSHNRLVPDSASDSFEGVGARDDIILRLVEGPVAVVTVPARFGELDRVSLWRKSDKHALGLKLRRDGERWRFTGYPPGRYSLYFELSGAGAVRMDGVDMGPEGTDLGTLRPPKGTTLRFRFPDSPDRAERTFRMMLYRVDRPSMSYSDHGRDSEHRELTYRFLGAGRYKAKIWTDGGTLQPEFVLDGKTDVEFVIKSRR